MAESLTLEQLAALAREAEKRGDLAEELRLWREAMHLAPPDSEEFRIIWSRVQELSAKVDAGGEPPKPPPNWKKRFGPLAPILLILWKFKGFVLLALTKGKLLLLGLSKFSTVVSMFAAFGGYWLLYGWVFAAGIISAIYVHEMGHVWALRQFGFAASAPMFIPFFGAFVRMKQHPANPIEDARVGLAGPIWGTAFAIAAFVAYLITDSDAIGVIAHFSAWINLFNLLPVWQLDGARGFAALSRPQRIGISLLMAALGLFLGEGFLYILAVLGLVRAFTKGAPEQGDTKTLIQFAGLLVVLALLMAVPVHRGYLRTT